MKKYKITHKLIIAIVIILILLLLVISAMSIIKLNNKDKVNLAQSSENELIVNEPNIPQLSAGMIPVKWDGTNWVITTSKDKDWYDYSKGKPAYIMLNDGTYQSELIRDMTNKELAENNVGVGVPDDPNIRGSIYIWIPRFAYKETGETGYIKEETELGGEWIVPTIFSYAVADETKPNFSLSGVWLEKDIDTNYANKIGQMNQEESIYGFIANTKPKQITSTDIIELQKFVGVGVPDDSIGDITNSNRIMLQIVNTNKYEPIKANIAQNTEEGRLEIRVTYTSNGIKEILDEYGNKMTLTEENGIIYTDTSNISLAKGTYIFTVIDNKGNKKELSIYPTVNSLFKVAYINGTDNMDNTNTYTKTQATKTTAENTLINQLTTIDDSKTYSRAITDSNKAITAITQTGRTAEDEQLYLYGKYKANSTTTYSWQEGSKVRSNIKYQENYGYRNISTDASTGVVTFSNAIAINYASTTYNKQTVYYYSSGLPTYSQTSQLNGSKTNSSNSYYKFVCTGIETGVAPIHKYWIFDVYQVNRTSTTTYSRGDFVSNLIAMDGTYKSGERNPDTYWYVRNSLSPKYTLQKYDSNLNLQSTYDVDSKVLTTEPIDISNKGNNKVKLTLNTTGTTYKTYISSDNTNWQEVTDITSNTPKELNVDGWKNLYIKIETNTSRINNIDVAFYKD